jgi:hypothetical protein
MDAFFRQFQRDRRADASVGPGNQCDFPVQPEIHPGFPTCLLDKHAGNGEKEQLSARFRVGQTTELGTRARFGYFEAT